MKILDKIIQIIIENIETEIAISATTDLHHDLDLDSFDVLMIMNEIDDTYGISLTDDDFAKVKNPSEIVSLLTEKYQIK